MFALDYRRFLRCVVLLLVWVMALFFGGRSRSQERAESSVYQQSAGSGVRQTAELVSSQKQAERLVASMLSRLGRVESISARIRQRTRAEGMVIVGTGRYLQQGNGLDQQFRFEVVNKADTEIFELLEVSDGISFWKFQKGSSTPVRLARVDISQIRTKLKDLGIEEGQAVAPHLGGLQGAIAHIRRYFQFESAERESLEGLPVWRVVGRWNSSRLIEIFPHLKALPNSSEGVAEEVPAGTPCSVELIIGSEQLFPFRITWSGRSHDGEFEPISILELYEVRLGEPIDSAAFVYKPSAEGLLDVTEQFVRGIQPLRQ
ncbi:MAG TPA: hypothetical protein DEB70_12845 [Planctomycetaceae bacterium]|nr:hypothetical protein [Planctomycetaceae bacterium]